MTSNSCKRWIQRDENPLYKLHCNTVKLASNSMTHSSKEGTKSLVPTMEDTNEEFTDPPSSN